MANVFNERTMLWTVTETGALTAAELSDASSPSLLNPTVSEVIFFPNAAGDDVVLQDGATTAQDAIVLKAGASDTSPVHKSFRPQGRRISTLTCSTLDGGTLYVYLM